MEINSAEVHAINRAIKISLSCEVIKSHPIIIESDSKNAVSWCNASNSGPWNLNFVLNSIRKVLHLHLKVEIVHKGPERIKFGG